jgi:hypothetical protein
LIILIAALLIPKENGSSFWKILYHPKGDKIYSGCFKMQPAESPLTLLTQEFSMDFAETIISGIQDARDCLLVKPVGISTLSNMERNESSCTWIIT